MAELQVALMLLTRLPAGRVREPLPGLAEAAWAFPLVGGLVGLAGWAGFAAATATGLPPPIGAALAVGVTVAATGALHEDAVADFADGIGGGRDRESRLEIMRDSRIGSFGAIALILAVLLRVLAIAELGGEASLLAAFVATAAVSRGVMLSVLVLMPPARADGMGRAASGPSGSRLSAGALLAALALLPLGRAGLPVALAAALAGAVVAGIAARRIGGQTGDVLGAVQVVSESAAWLALAALLGSPAA